MPSTTVQLAKPGCPYCGSHQVAKDMFADAYNCKCGAYFTPVLKTTNHTAWIPPDMSALAVTVAMANARNNEHSTNTA